MKSPVSYCWTTGPQPRRAFLATLSFIGLSFHWTNLTCSSRQAGLWDEDKPHLWRREPTRWNVEGIEPLRPLGSWATASRGAHATGHVPWLIVSFSSSEGWIAEWPFQNVEGRLWESQGGLRKRFTCDSALGLHLRDALVQKLAAQRLAIRESGIACSPGCPAAAAAAVVGTDGIACSARTPCCIPLGIPASFGRGMFPMAHVCCLSSESLRQFRRVGLGKDSCYFGVFP